MLRDTNRGRRAGKINDALDVIKNAGYDVDYVALIDFNNTPAKDYIIICVAAFERFCSFFNWLPFCNQQK
jgi:hypothetical protein